MRCSCSTRCSQALLHERLQLGPAQPAAHVHRLGQLQPHARRHRNVVWTVDNDGEFGWSSSAGAAVWTYHLWKREGSPRSAQSPSLRPSGCIIVLGFAPSADGSWNDDDFWISLRNTLVFTLFSTPILIALGLGLALLLNNQRKARGVYRAVFFLPYVLPISAVTLIWSYLLNPDRGLIAGFLGWFGIEGIPFLSDPNLAMPSIIATTVWWSVGFNLVLFLAGLQDIEPNLYEAAGLDGASAWQRFRHITCPGLRHVTVLVTVTQLIACFQIFGQVFIMTKGGPGTSTEVAHPAHLRDRVQATTNSATPRPLSVFLFLVMAAVSAVQFRLTTQGTHDEHHPSSPAVDALTGPPSAPPPRRRTDETARRAAVRCATTLLMIGRSVHLVHPDPVDAVDGADPERRAAARHLGLLPTHVTLANFTGVFQQRRPRPLVRQQLRGHDR